MVSSYLYKKLIRPIFIIRSSHHSVALGVSLGLFVGLTPTVGLQMVLVLVVGTLIKANRIIALILCWISNPLTFLPMYYGYYWLGAVIFGREIWTFRNFSQKMDELVVAKQELGYVGMFKLLGSDVFLPMTVGSIIIGLVVAIPAYPLTLRALRRHKARRDARRRERQARLAVQRAEEGGTGTPENGHIREAGVAEARQKEVPECVTTAAADTKTGTGGTRD